MTIANQLYFNKDQLPQPLANRLVRLAAFQNPEFYRAQAMRFPVWNKPRVIGCAENFPKHIALPRGCLDSVTEMLDENDIAVTIQDERFEGIPISAGFAGTLRLDQKSAVSGLLRHDSGVLCAPTAFGKTVAAAAVIAQRAVNTLILVHRTELLRQWDERMRAFLDISSDSIGLIGGGKKRPSGQVDIAVMQSVARMSERSEFVQRYGQIIVDECHHLPAVSFEAILKCARARFILGLTATPFRRDGQHPIIFMQCGPIRHSASRSPLATLALQVLPQFLDTQVENTSALAIHEVFRRLARDSLRNVVLAEHILEAYRRGRKVIVLTERTDHLRLLEGELEGRIDKLFVLQGRMSRKQRVSVISNLEALPDDAPRVLLATGRLIGEGFDHAPLDTLVLALPISWKGTLQQYAGRLHRQHPGKRDIRIYDFIDTGYPVLMKMWERRQRGYQAMGYHVASSVDG